MAKAALLIGVSTYDFNLSPLPAAIRDIAAVQKVLQDPDIGAFDAKDIKMLINPESHEMLEEIETLFIDRKKGDLVLLYFSGHGFTNEEGLLHLASRTTKHGRLSGTAVAADFVHRQMESSRSKQQVVILDCCFSGAFARGMTVKTNAANIGDQLRGEGRAVLTSSGSIEYSFEQKGEQLSLYTEYLVEGMRTGAADRNEDGYISVDELHEYAKRKVQEAAPAMKPAMYAASEGYKIVLASAPIADQELAYRRDVERLADRGKISFVARRILDLRRVKLGLLQEVTNAVEAEVLKPFLDYQQKIQQYEHVLREAMKLEYPISDRIRSELRDFQHALAIKEDDATLIESRLSESIIFKPLVRLSTGFSNLKVLRRSFYMLAPTLAVSSLTFFLLGKNLSGHWSFEHVQSNVNTLTHDAGNTLYAKLEQLPTFKSIQDGNLSLSTPNTQASVNLPSSENSAPSPGNVTPQDGHLDQPDSGRAVAASPRKTEQPSVSTLLKEGQKQFKQKHYQEAMTAFSQAIVQRKSGLPSKVYADAYKGRGYTQWTLGKRLKSIDPKRAIALFKQAVYDYRTAANLYQEENKIQSYNDAKLTIGLLQKEVRSRF